MISSREQYYQEMLLDPDLAGTVRHNRIMEEAYEREAKAAGGPLTEARMVAMSQRNDAEAKLKELNDQAKDKKGEL